MFSAERRREVQEMTDKKKKLALMAAFSAVALIAIIFTGLKSEMALRLGDPYNIKILFPIFAFLYFVFL